MSQTRPKIPSQNSQLSKPRPTDLWGQLPSVVYDYWLLSVGYIDYWAFDDTSLPGIQRSHGRALGSRDPHSLQHWPGEQGRREGTRKKETTEVMPPSPLQKRSWEMSPCDYRHYAASLFLLWLFPYKARQCYFGSAFLWFVSRIWLGQNRCPACCCCCARGWVGFFFLFFFYRIFKGYFLFTVITKYWFYSPCCTIHPWAYLTPNSLCLPLSHPSIAPPPSLSPLVTTSLFSVSVSLLLFCYIH